MEKSRIPDPQHGGGGGGLNLIFDQISKTENSLGFAEQLLISGWIKNSLAKNKLRKYFDFSNGNRLPTWYNLQTYDKVAVCYKSMNAIGASLFVCVPFLHRYNF
jgi:hypothetical protein